MVPAVAESDESLTKVSSRSETRIAAYRPRFRLRIERGTGPRIELAPSSARVVVGRGVDADLIVEDEAVSRLHFEIVSEEDCFVLRDLGSRNGTWLGALRVREVCLPMEARISLGDSELGFNLIGAGDELPLHPENRFGRLIGRSEIMRTAFARLARVAARDTTLLLEGESGTGKELAAEAVHLASARRDGPFVVIDCGAIPKNLLEAELFGHERGAYTGASHARLGAFVRANGGTVFLDEIGELDIELQPRLLRVLESREVRPIGGAEPISVDVRIIAATNRDLLREVNRGAFREDLYYRLAVACVRLPALRERPTDIPVLFRHFLEQHALRDERPYVVEDSVVERLVLRPWPGNIRELRNVVEQIAAFGTEDFRLAEAPVTQSPIDVPFKVAKAQLVEQFERDYLISTLQHHGGNITAAATSAKLDRVHFLRLLDRYGLRKSRSRPPPP